jgi:hypothetical protein
MFIREKRNENNNSGISNNDCESYLPRNVTQRKLSLYFQYIIDLAIKNILKANLILKDLKNEKQRVENNGLFYFLTSSNEKLLIKGIKMIKTWDKLSSSKKS